MAGFTVNNRIRLSGLSITIAVVLIAIAISAIFHFHRPEALVAGGYVIDRQAQPFTYQPLLVESVTFWEVFWLLILGFVSGIIGGMLGMGGGLLKVSGMYLFFGYEVILARVITLLTYSCISISSFFKYREFKLIIWDVVKILASSAIVGVIAGVLLGNIINSVWLEKLLGIYAVCVAVAMVFQARSGSAETKAWNYKAAFADKISFIGVLKGFFCGLFGISGGIISVPLQQFLLKMPVKNSIANSLTSAMFSATFAASLALVTGIAAGFFKPSLPLFLALPLVPGTIIGARIGAGITKRMDTVYIKMIFSLIALIMGLRILFFRG